MKKKDYTEISDYTDIVKEFLEKYSKDRLPIQINIKELTEGVKFQDRATHLIHTYPAKLVPNLPYFFLNNGVFSEEGDVVLDPFSGSGTVLLEAILLNRNSLGCDSNPLALLISKVKTRDYNCDKLLDVSEKLRRKVYNSPLIIEKLPEVVNMDYWFHNVVKLQLNTLLHFINKIKTTETKEFFILCLLNCVKKVSLADQKISVPVRVKDDELNKIINNIKENPTYTYDRFFDIVKDNILKFIKKKHLTKHQCAAQIIAKDAKNLSKIQSNSVDLIITSPPYAGAQKYIRASSLSLCWLGYSKKTSLRELDKKNIGRENYKSSEFLKLKKTGINKADELLQNIYLINPLRAHIAANYLIEMRKAIKESIRVLKKNKYMILIAANNQVCGYEFETQEYLRLIAEQEGLTTECRLVDDIKSYGLMTKRNKTASIITCEWILILKKSND